MQCFFSVLSLKIRLEVSLDFHYDFFLVDILAVEVVLMIGTIGIQDVIGRMATDDHTVDLPCPAESGTRVIG